ncbi:uncharacterized protein LOC115757693 isoform X1 [Drosophila novamexicana]|uniref:uncharacterized protein LOC115757693 isoform X1 n=1 Tax=Drosophila novamexicana TaxID=47314 RepID=UPI0011E5FB64|nr:uncharacterized protein LOC115757693 isoform X1 [Drosophila novamexicana]
MSKIHAKLSVTSKLSSIHESSSSIDVASIFPKPLPVLKVGPVYDESGFTLNERLALRQAWKLIKPFERRYGKDIYFTFIMKYYKTFENFRYNGKLDMHRLHGHSLAFMRYISAVIDQNDPVLFQAMLSDNHIVHTRCHVSQEHMRMLMNALIDYVLDKLQDVSSAALKSGFQRLLEKFQVYFDQQTVSFIAYKRSLSKGSLSAHSDQQ